MPSGKSGADLIERQQKRRGEDKSRKQVGDLGTIIVYHKNSTNGDLEGRKKERAIAIKFMTGLKRVKAK